MNNYLDYFQAPQHTFSVGLTNRIEFLKQQADDFFLLDDFLARMRKDFHHLLIEAGSLSDYAYCQLMQKSEIRFFHDFISGYSERLNNVETIISTKTEGVNLLQQLREHRDRLVSNYAMADVTDKWQDFKKHPDDWKGHARQLYEAKEMFQCEKPQQLVFLVGQIAFLTSILTGHADRFDLQFNYDQLPSVEQETDDKKAKICAIIRLLIENKELTKQGEWGLLMIAYNQVKGKNFFVSPQSFADYCKGAPQLEGIKLPSESSISKMVGKMMGQFPNWTFTDTTDNKKVNKRINIAKRFINEAQKAGLI